MTPAELLQAIDRFVLSLQQATQALDAGEQPDLSLIDTAMQQIQSAAAGLAPGDARRMLMPLNEAVLAVDRLQDAMAAAKPVKFGTP